MKCELCKHTVQETFLRKPHGSYVKDTKGKKHLICSNCQRQIPMQEIKEKF